MIDTPFVGKWLYRSFRNEPTHKDELAELLFGEGELEITASPLGTLKGRFDFGGGFGLDVRGSLELGSPFTARFQGVGTGIAAAWIYDYIGYLVPAWPAGIDQRPAIVGSVIRTVPHDGGAAKAGFVASFIAVKKD